MTITKEQIDALVQIVRKVESESKMPDGNFDLGKWSLGLALEAKQQGLKALEVRRNNECGLYYDGCHAEYIMWTLAMIAMSYTLELLKGKVEIGHCQNIAHGPDGKRMCQKGSSFHKDMYDDCVTMMHDTLDIITKIPPKVVAAP